MVKTKMNKITNEKLKPQLKQYLPPHLNTAS